MSNATMRGLAMFISDVRACTTKEQEEKRVIKELAHIREKFTKTLDGYNRKKYVWKLLYIYMLGYDIEFGHMIALKLITGTKFSEKTAGYTAIQILLNDNADLLRLIIQAVKKDLQPTSQDYDQCLALSCVANVGGQEFAEALSGDVQKLVVAGSTRSFVRKKAALCLLRLFRKFPEQIPQEGFAPRILALLDDSNYGVVTSVMSLLIGLVSHNTQGFEEAPTRAIRLLRDLAFNKQTQERKSSYKYYSTVSPWLQVKLLRLLQYFPPPKEPELAKKLKSTLEDILAKTKITQIVNKNNADHSILFEAINVIIQQCLYDVTDLQNQAIGHLGKFLSTREPNFRYLGLNTMAKLARVSGSLKDIRRHQDAIQVSLKDLDPSIRKRALDLLYVMCDRSNCESVVESMIQHLHTEAMDTREELVLKIAILAEKFAPNLEWYVQTILQLIQLAGDFVTDDIWHRVVQIITNNEELQEHAATTCFTFMANPSIHENGVKLAAYVLGEFGHKIPDAKMIGEGGEKILEILMLRYKTAQVSTKALILTALVKLGNSYANLRPQIDKIFESHRTYVDTEVQQRACEYYNLDHSFLELATYALSPMPVFPERRSLLLRNLRKKKADGATDRDVWNDDDEKEDEEEEEEEEEEQQAQMAEDIDGYAEPGEVKKKPAARSAAPMDLLGLDDHDGGDGGGDSSGDEADAKSHKTSGGGGFDDLFGFESTPSVPAGKNPFPPQDESLLPTLFQDLSGTIYENDLLSIQFKAPAGESSSEFRLALYMTNKIAQPFIGNSLTLVDNPAFSVQTRLTINKQAYKDPNTPFTLEQNKPVVYLFLWSVRRPFSDAPSIIINLNHAGRTYNLALKLPISLGHYTRAGSPTDSGGFIDQWKSLNTQVGPTVFKLPAPITRADYDRILTNVFKLQLITGVDQEPNNVYAFGIFSTITKDARGNHVSMVVLVRLETKPNIAMFRATVRAGHTTVSTAFTASLGHIFNATEKK